MRRLPQAGLAAFLLLVTSPAWTAVTAAERYIIRYAAGAEQAVQASVVSHRGRIHRMLSGRRLLAVSLPEPAMSLLRADPAVELLEIDPKRYTQAEATPYGIGMVQADSGAGGLAENPGTTRTICVMDTGYDLGHEDRVFRR
ncbi:MAG: hypothetical protein ACK2U9_16365 [Anaerolineae bacterium]